MASLLLSEMNPYAPHCLPARDRSAITWHKGSDGGHVPRLPHPIGDHTALLQTTSFDHEGQRREPESSSQHLISPETPNYLADNSYVLNRTHRQFGCSGGCTPTIDNNAQQFASCSSMTTMCPNTQLSIPNLEMPTQTPIPQELGSSAQDIGYAAVADSMIDADSSSRTLRVQDNDVLQQFYHTRRTLILDSTRPESVPHIVISFVEDTWEDYHTYWNNRVHYQYPTHLVVPPTPISIESIPSHLREHSLSQESVSPSGACQGQLISNGVVCQPKRVFSPGRLIRYHEKSKIESIKYPKLIQMLHVKQLKASMLLVNDKATSLHRRCKSSQLDAEIDKPFCWTDPAEPLLEFHRRLPGTTIIDSPSPFTVPHIIINAPPPQDFMISWQNATNNPQDCGFGRYLTVPNKYVHFENIPFEGWDPSAAYPQFMNTDIDSSTETNYIEDDDDNVNGHETDLGIPHKDVDSSDDDTEEPWCWTPSPSTPVCGTGGLDLVVIAGEEQDHAYEEDEEDSDDEMVLMANRNGQPRFMHTYAHRFGQAHTKFGHVDDGELPPLENIKMLDSWFAHGEGRSRGEDGGVDGSGCGSDDTDEELESSVVDEGGDLSTNAPLQPPCAVFDDDEEDDLPPFDEWYQEIARRNQLEWTTA